MRSYFWAYVVVIIWPNVSISMDGENYESDENEPPYVEISSIQETVDGSLELIESAREQLVLLCEGYVTYLDKAFGCGVCRAANAIFNTKAFEHTEKRKKQLNYLLATLKSPAKPNFRLYQDYLILLAFKGKVGRSFSLSCSNTLKLCCPNIEDELDEESRCTICMHRSREVLFYPCAHFISCKQCFHEWSGDCPKCRGTVERHKFVELLSICTLCKKNVANMLATSCAHVAVCDTCVLPKNKATCTICFSENQNFERVNL
jgi:hypothetical protein